MHVPEVPVRTLGLGLICLLIAACGPTDTAGDDLGSTDPATSAATTTTHPPTTTTVASTTTTGASPAVTGPVAVFWVDDPSLVLVDAGGVVVREVPLDPRAPSVWSAIDDGSDGLVVSLMSQGTPQLPGVSLQWFAAGAHEPAPLEGVGSWWPPVLANFDGRSVVLVLEETGEDRHDAATSRDVRSVSQRLLAVPLGHVAGTTLLDHEYREYWSPGGSTYDGPMLIGYGYAGGRLMLQWFDHETGCSWLEFRQDGEIVAVSVNPMDRTAGCHPATRVALSRDGRYLVLGGNAPEPMSVFDMDSGRSVWQSDQLAARVAYDGDRSFVAVLFSPGNATEQTDTLLFGRIDETGVDTTEIPKAGRFDAAILIGALPRSPRLPDDLSLASRSPFTPCSASGLAIRTIPDLPQPVAATRVAIASAATTCDLFALFDVAAEESSYTWQYGNQCGDEPVPLATADPLPVWFAGEVADGAMAALVALLDEEPVSTESGAYLWSRGPDSLEIGLDGGWRLFTMASPTEPCETIWCTC